MRFSIPLMAASLIAVVPASAADLMTTPVGFDAPAAKRDLAASLRFSGAFGFGVDGYDSDFDGSFADIGANARVGGERWTLEAFTEFNSDIGSGDDDDDDDDGGTTGGLAAHLLHRGAERTYGLFGGIAGASFYDDSDWSMHVFGGLEGIHYFGDSALFGQLGYQAAIVGQTDDDTWQQGPFGRVGLRHYLTDDSKLELDLAGGFGTFDQQDNSYMVAWGVAYEHRLSGPFAAGLFYRGTFMDVGDSGPVDQSLDHVFGVSLTVDVNAMTIRERDELLPFETPGPLFHRGFSWTESVF